MQFELQFGTLQLTVFLNTPSLKLCCQNSSGQHNQKYDPIE
jgi:hypothetical protein